MLLIAHRGASAHAPENTIAAYRKALEAGPDGIEVDVRLTADGVPVLMHDDDTARTTATPGRISSMTLREVRALDAAARADGWGRREAVPTLEEFLALCAGRTRLFLELKGALRSDGYVPAEPVARAVAPMIAGVADVVVSSFDPVAVAAMRALAPGVATGIGCLPLFAPDWALEIAVAAGHAECHLPQDMIDADVVARAHEAGVRVLGWTVNEAGRLRALDAIGCDGVFTDDPAGARAALAR